MVVLRVLLLKWQQTHKYITWRFTFSTIEIACAQNMIMTSWLDVITIVYRKGEGRRSIAKL
jgi:hypothetical protein